MAYIPPSLDPNPRPTSIDENYRSKTFGLRDASLRASDDPSFQYVSVGEDSKQNPNQINDPVVDDLMKNYQKAQQSVLRKLHYYPESLGNINSKSYVQGHEVPRHALKITILDYAGGNLLSKEAKRKLDNYLSDISTGEFGEGMPGFFGNVGALTDVASEILSNPNLYSSEVNNYQDRANQLSRNGFNDTVNAAIAEGEQKDKYQNAVKNVLNSPGGKEIASQYLTAGRNPYAFKRLTDYIASQTQVNVKMLPDDVKSIIYLYASGENLNYTYSTNWNAVDQAGVFQDLMNMGANIAKNGFSMDTFGDIGSIIGKQILRGGLSDKNNVVVQTIAAKAGLAPAQNYEYLFDSVGRRSFSVAVNFYPKSENEIQSAAKIISAFKYYSHPSRENRSALVKVPCVFMLENMTYSEGTGWVENLYLPKYKICALLNTNVNYSQNGTLVTHQEFMKTQGGFAFKAPIKISMNLSFQEMHILTREDIPKPENFFDSDVKRDGYY